jgi:hypothetical protein
MPGLCLLEVRLLLARQVDRLSGALSAHQPCPAAVRGRRALVREALVLVERAEACTAIG